MKYSLCDKADNYKPLALFGDRRNSMKINSFAFRMRIFKTQMAKFLSIFRYLPHY